MKESYIESKFRRDWELRTGGLCIKLVAMFFKGIPDRICLAPGGCLVFVELKAPGKKPRASQNHVHSLLRNLGFRVEIIDSIEEASKLVDEYAL